MSKHQFTDIRVPIEPGNPSIQRHEEKCIKCGQCKQVCTNDIAVAGTYDLRKTGDIPICIHCGQCANVCPVESITEVYEYDQVREAVKAEEKIVIFSTSPSVRAALGEEFGLEEGSFVQDQMVALIRRLGADYVLDTNFAADLTIMEEASELVERVSKANKPLPQFTSCCPAWVKFVETYYPDMREHISTAKSPIGMQGPTIKTYFAKKMGIDPEKIVNVAVTPCTAKKFEIRREEMNAASKYLGIEGMRDMDYVITTRELAKWAREEEIDFVSLEGSDYDDFMGEASGAGVIFGNTGGVMEAAVRTAYHFITKEEAPEELYDLQPVRGLQGIKEASVRIGDLDVKVAVVYGTANAKKLMEKIKTGEADYHFVEVMTCPGGCIGGGGQPKDTKWLGDTLREKRIKSLYDRDKSMELRLSHRNEEIVKLYEDFYGEPLSKLAEEMLHTGYFDRSGDLDAGSGEGMKGSVKSMSKFKCSICGYIYDEEKEGALITELKECPICKNPINVFEKLGAQNSDVVISESSMTEEAVRAQDVESEEENENPLAYPKEFVRKDSNNRFMSEIHQMAMTGETIIEAMGTRMPMPNWDDILILGAQLNPPPLDEHAPVDITTVIGKHAKKPMVLEGPVYISHMSFGALSKEVKEALAKGSAMAKTAMCSGEGGILPEERDAAYKYIFEYVPNHYSVTPENLKNADAIEIKIGQGTKPGMGGHLPGGKVTPEIAKIRNKPIGQDVISPSKFEDINTKEDLRDIVEQLRFASEGRPIGIKIAAGRIEKDLEFCVFAKPDFITIDGRGGATGASPKIVRDATSVPTIYALYRARKYLDEAGADIDLVITGGLRISSDFAKAIAMGADAVAVASAGLIAAACQQYRICGSGNCPVGVATQDPELRKRLKVDSSAKRVANFLNCSFKDLKTFARITGHENLHDMNVSDLCTIDREISEFTNIPHA